MTVLSRTGSRGSRRRRNVARQQLVNRRDQHRDRKRLEEHLRRAQEPARGEVVPPAAGYRDDVHGRMRVPELHQHREPFFLWHHDVRDHQVRAGLPKEVEAFLAVARFDHGVALEFQVLPQQGADGVVVLNEEDASHEPHQFSRSRSSHRGPRAMSLSEPAPGHRSSGVHTTASEATATSPPGPVTRTGISAGVAVDVIDLQIRRAQVTVSAGITFPHFAQRSGPGFFRSAMGSGTVQTSGGTAREPRPRELEMASDMRGTPCIRWRNMPDARGLGARVRQPWTRVGEPTLPRLRGSQPPAHQMNDRARTRVDAAERATEAQAPQASGSPHQERQPADLAPKFQRDHPGDSGDAPAGAIRSLLQ